MERRRVVRVPASSANLGPGFDSFAAAVAIHMELEVVETGRFAVVTDLPIARDRRNLAVRGFERLAPPDAFEFRIRSDIPLSGGLGSSAAACLAGLLAADHLFELDADVFAAAVDMEGHPDNVAAALHGGFVVCADDDVVRLDAPAGLEAVLVVPHEPVRTKQAREALPEQVPIADAVFNTAHAAVLMLGLARGDWDLVARGLADRLHQPHRAHLYPRPWRWCTGRRSSARSGRRSRGGPDGARVVHVRADRRRGRGAAARDRRVGRRAARALRAPRGGRAGVVGAAAAALPYCRMTTGVPRGMVRMSDRMVRSLARRQPSDAAVPMLAGAVVPWIAMRSPPPQPWGSLGWRPVRASAQQP